MSMTTQIKKVMSHTIVRAVALRPSETLPILRTETMGQTVSPHCSPYPQQLHTQLELFHGVRPYKEGSMAYAPQFPAH